VGNQRNGTSGKTVLPGEGPVRIEVPRDRDGSFEPLLIPKHQRRFTGFDQNIIAMYARVMTMREIQGFLLESYGTEVSAEFISSVTEAVMAEVTAWQARPLEPLYPVVFFASTKIASRRALRRMSTDFPTAAVGSSRAPTATVEKPFTASNTKFGQPRLATHELYPSGD
jgi:transposase-like protein